MPTVKIKKLHANAVVPEYKTSGAAGMDLCAVLDAPVQLAPGKPVLIPTGLSVELPHGYEAQVRSRSGLSLKGVCVANSPGTVDADYRGEVKVILVSLCDNYIVQNGDRIAQMVIAAAPQATIEIVDELSATERGSGGFGSTGR